MNIRFWSATQRLIQFVIFGQLVQMSTYIHKQEKLQLPITIMLMQPRLHYYLLLTSPDQSLENDTF